MRRPLPKLLPLVLIALASCVPSEDGSSTDPLGSSGTGGGGQVLGTGGAPSGSGGQQPTGSGGAPFASGGAPGTGGTTGSGGVTGTGGAITGSGGRLAAPDGGVTPGSGGQFGGPDGGVAPGTGGRTQADAGSTAVVCTSKMNYSGGNGQQMRPGADCNGCHNFQIAGTVYPTAHEPDNCIGVNGNTGLKVVITGATGTVLTLTPNSSGNFYSNTNVTTPFTVKLTNGAATRMMVSPQTSGACNSCHTSIGANAAPGRVMSP